MKGILIATLISCTLFSTASCIFFKEIGDFVGSIFSPTKPPPPVRHCRWLNWKGTKCVKNPSGKPKYIIYQRRTKIGALNGGRPCTGSSYRKKECSEAQYTAEVFYTTFFSRSLRTSSTLFMNTSPFNRFQTAFKVAPAKKLISNPCSPTVYGANGKIRILGKCVKQGRKRRNAEGLIEYFDEPIEDTVKDRVKRASTVNRDVLFLLDESGSIKANEFPLLKEMVNALLSKLSGDISIGEKKTRVAAMTFSTNPKIHFDFDYSFIRARVMYKISRIPQRGGRTCLTKALKEAKGMLTTTARGARYGVAGTERVIVLLSDGCANCDRSKLADMRRQLEDKGISLVSLFITNDDYCLRTIEDLFTGATCYEAFRLNDWEEFETVIDYIKEQDPVTRWRSASCPT